MKKIGIAFLLAFVTIKGNSQSLKKQKKSDTQLEHSLLWKISGNGLQNPSYLFGTMHLLCKQDAGLSENFKLALAHVDKVYFELDLDNVLDMLGAISRMKMRNDTTLADLLTKAEYEKVKSYIEAKKRLLPFNTLQKYKPFVASSMLMEAAVPCEDQVSMEQVIMEQAQKNKMKIEGLETTAFQMSIFDSIPYKEQAQALLKMIAEEGTQKVAENEFAVMMKAYKEQDLQKLAQMINADTDGMGKYQDLLLNNRNKRWVASLKKIMANHSLMIAVGAGHLPGELGVIKLLQKEGYTVEAVNNSIPPKKLKSF
ncbi:MAG: hypothetical protein RL115_828 [Bacteroidota bacterium]